MLEYRLECARNNRKSDDLEKQSISIPDKIKEDIKVLKWNLKDYLVAETIGSAIIFVFW